MIKQFIHSLGRRYVRTICQSEFEAQQFRRWNERPVEFRFVFEQLTKFCGEAKTVADVGTGTTALPHLIANCGFLVTAIDNMRDYWNETMVNRHFHVLDDDITQSSLPSASFDVVTCISVLEHIPHHQKAVASMLRILRPGGHLILTCPYHESEYHPNVYHHPDSSIGKGLPFVCQSYSRTQLDEWTGLGASVVLQEFWDLWEGKLWSLGAKRNPPRRSSVSEPHQLTCLLLAKKP